MTLIINYLQCPSISRQLLNLQLPEEGGNSIMAANDFK